MASKARRIAAVLLFALAASAYFNFFPMDIVMAMNWAITAELWVINHAAFPGFFLLFSAIGLGLMVPDIWSIRKLFLGEREPASAEEIVELMRGVGNFFYFALKNNQPAAM